MKKTLFILHPGKANYPDIDAYKDYFKNQYDVIDGVLLDYEKVHNKTEVILWCIMGYYPTSLEAKFVIHDYRSLSVGKFTRFKDLTKKLFNVKPNLRIFLNPEVERVMGFNDKIPSCLLDMGVPKWIFDIKPVSKIKGTFCYIGEMTIERGFDKVIDSFLINKKDGHTFVLVGDPDKEILERYDKEISLIFTGKVPQKEALEIVKSCENAVCFIPYHRPYCFQTPTKLLEYAALGMNIICNNSASNIISLSALEVEAKVTDKLIFSNFINERTIYKSKTKIQDLVWTQVIKSSGVETYI